MNAIDTKTYRDSLTTLLRNKNRTNMVDDPKYVAGAQRVLDFMHDNWQQQKLCDVVISANNGDLQVRSNIIIIFTARCTLVQSAVLRSHVVCLSVCLSVCPSVCPSVTLVDCDHTGWNTSEIISPLVSLGCSLTADPNIRGIFQGEHPEILAQSDPPLLI